MLYGAGYSSVGLWVGIFCTGAVLFSTFATRGAIANLHQIVSRSQRLWWSAFKELLLLFRLKSFRYFVATLLTFMASAGMALGLAAYIAKFYWKFNETQIFINAISVIAALLPVKFIADKVCARFEKQMGSGAVVWPWGQFWLGGNYAPSCGYDAGKWND